MTSSWCSSIKCLVIDSISSGGQPWNVESVSVSEMTGSKSQLEHRPMPEDDPRQRRPDISQAESVLGWRPSVELREGLVQTIAYFDALLSGQAR